MAVRTSARSATVRDQIVAALNGLDRSVVEHARRAANIAQEWPFLGRPQRSGAKWCEWVQASVPPTDPAYRWLMDPPDVSGGQLGNGRHRVTYLRLLCEPAFEVVTYAEQDVR